jgi:hypothetical protein
MEPTREIQTHAPPTANRPTPRRSTGVARAFAGIGASSGLALLLTAATLQPADAGHGTHTQLGLPPCTWAVAFDRPCITCGMTTSFAHAAEGDLLTAATIQPFGLLLAVGTAVGVWVAGHTALTGSTLGPALARMATARTLCLSVGILLAAWAYKFLTWTG